MFGRKKSRPSVEDSQDAADDDVDAADSTDDASQPARSESTTAGRTQSGRRQSRALRRARNDAAEAQRETAERPSTTEGPWDMNDAPDDGVNRVDLGALRVPTLDGVELRLEAAPTGEVIAVLLTDGTSSVQVGVFAAPRSAGIWAELRTEIIDQIATEGGAALVQDGSFGPEVLATVVGPDGSGTVRFTGIDGPRWFVRALFTGPAATDAAAAALLEESVRALVVARGGDAMPVRDPLPLHLPEAAMQAAQEARAAGEPEEADGPFPASGSTDGQADGPGDHRAGDHRAADHSAGERSAADQGSPGRHRRAPGMPRRGPEITETR